MIAQRMLRHLVVAAVVVGVATAGEAQQSAPGRFAVQGGLSMPTGDLGDIADLGFQIGGAYEFKAGNRTLRANADWTRHGLKDVSGSWTQLGVMLNALFPFATDAYGLVGAGFYNEKAELSAGSSTISEDDSNFAFNLGVGMNRKNTYIEARYLSVQSSGSSSTSIPIVFGWRF